MYESSCPGVEDALEQGDIIKIVPLPCIKETESYLNYSVKKGGAWHDQFTPSFDSPPSDEDCDQRGIKAYLCSVIEYPLIVLTQDCDLTERVMQDRFARILVAPLFPLEDSTRVSELEQRAVEKPSGRVQERYLAELGRGDVGAVVKLVEKRKDAIDKNSLEVRKKISLGEYANAFPLAGCKSNGTTLKPSICFLDFAMTVPSSWCELLRKRRFHRLKPEWKGVLQNQLRDWLGRYAYPRDKAARIAEAGLIEIDSGVEGEREGEASAAQAGKAGSPATGESGASPAGEASSATTD